ncbi:response regulator [bacterium]|nr:response regulator [bacterium]
MTTKVLIVDDNELYRRAFCRNLMLLNYDVVEAENADEALGVYDREKPDLVITDLSMRTPTEGLDVIRAIKRLDPLIPVVLISAVGTFEEGSMARELGADRVLMKQKIDEQLDDLYKAIEDAKSTGVRLRELREEINSLSSIVGEPSSEAVSRLREIIAAPRQHPLILAEAYDALSVVNEREIRASLEAELRNDETPVDMEPTKLSLRQYFPDLEKFEPETLKELCVAEYFFQRQGGDRKLRGDFSRNIGFSYCFAVENEAKARLRKKLQRFLSDQQSVKLIRSLMDPRTGQLDLFYHQYLLRLQQMYMFDFTVDNVKQVFQRILEHESRYKPDGLKALGIMIVCFGRDYQVKSMKNTIRVTNPLGLKAFDRDEMVLRFAFLLVSLQHYRNPYIHPEISEMEKVSKIRETAIECLKDIARVS